MEYTCIIYLLVYLLNHTYHGIKAYICNPSPNSIAFLGNYRCNYEKYYKYIAKNNSLAPIFSQDVKVDESEAGSDETIRKIRFLRTSTGRGTQDCYMALKNAKGDVRIAAELLLSELKTDESRKESASSPIVDLLDGRIAIKTTDKLATVIDIRCETDFVAKSKTFASLAKSLVNAIHETKLENLLSSNEPKCFEDFISSVMNKRCLRCNNTLKESGMFTKGVLKEDLVISRIGFIRPKGNELLFSYIHGPTESEGALSLVGTSSSVLVISAKDNSGTNKIGDEFYNRIVNDTVSSENNCCVSSRACVYSTDEILSNVDSSEDEEYNKVKKLCKQLSMHVMAEKPKALTLEEYDKEAVEQFIKEVRETIKGDKPQEIVDKIVAGRVKKQFGEVILTEQV
ncbi:elongation factor ts, putative [Theileria equi strain WA]|uniref:Elongation factor ts, putative n=1 Tax=Theileria equi strain WA TaxID=1537102 RepID=L0AZT1_THEEQ|nr:elongation factor ts, putative [Theileria equi strain WA]AFZ81112.1 elongation factor ts, putative [Theileria equi strain WA]|eukprot:XP_004830778.1 elongation factor ts, putative [Theileria equi strain WA]